MLSEYMLDLKEGTRVLVRPESYIEGGVPFMATVRGIATAPIAVIGRSVIVQPDVQIGEFSCIAVFELHLVPTNQ